MNIGGKTICQSFNLRFKGNTIHSLVTFLRVVPIRATNTTTKYKIKKFSYNSIKETVKTFIYHHI